MRAHSGGARGASKPAGDPTVDFYSFLGYKNPTHATLGRGGAAEGLGENDGSVVGAIAGHMVSVIRDKWFWRGPVSIMDFSASTEARKSRGRRQKCQDFCPGRSLGRVTVGWSRWRRRSDPCMIASRQSLYGKLLLDSAISWCEGGQVCVCLRPQR